MRTSNPRNILFVEDDPVAQLAVSRIFQRLQLPITVTLAASRKAAEAILARHRFDGAILDYHLGDGTALDLLPLLSELPVVVTTGVGSEEIAAAAMKAGASDYIVKDIEGRYLEKLPHALVVARLSKMRQRQLEGRLKAGLTRLKLVNQELNCMKFALDEHSLVSITDLSGRIRYVNGKFCATSGYSRKELLGRDHRIVNSGYHPKAFFARMWSTLRDGEVWHGEIRNRAKDGSYYWVNTTIVPFRDVDGKVTQFTSIRTDITEQKRFAMQLARAKEDAEAASRIKSEFLANMSHEIRTPINGILGTAELLQQSELDEEQEETLRTLVASANTLLTLVNDILDLSKIEAGMMALESIPFSPLAVVTEVAELLAANARSKGLELVVSTSPCLPCRLMGDPMRLKQVLLNLAGNAVKFTETGHVVLEMDCLKAGSGNVSLAIAVRDSGIGILPEKVGALFEKFTQADATTTRRFGGSGLGLAISRELVELMGGEIKAESRPGAGSAFSFEVLLRLPPGEEPPGPDTRLLGKRALLLDTGGEGIRTLAKRLETIGTEHASVSSFAEAAGLLAEASAAGKPYDFVLLGNASVDEVEAWMARLRARGILPPTRVIYQAANGNREERDRLSESGVAAYLTEPMATSEILDAMATTPHAAGTGSPLITRKRLSQSPGFCRRLPETRQPALRFARPYHILLAEDNAVNQMITTRALERFGCRVTIARDGREALESALRTPFDLILMDCHMPEMDGWEATRRIRASGSACSRVPIIALTADAMEGDRERCLQAGMDDYLGKPVKQETLWRALKGVLPES